MKGYTLRDFAEEVLRQHKVPLTTMEIWQYGKALGYDKKGGFIGRTPWTTISHKLMIDIQENPNSKFVLIGNSRPKKFFLKELQSIFTKEEIPKVIEKPKLQFEERELHSYLTYFAYTFMGRIYTKTIRHNKSLRQTNYQKWLHPDLVGVSYPIGIWENETIDLSKEMGLIPLKIFSFELKKVLDDGNLRESFFQAVSNSSWAHEGYLVTALLEQDDEFMKELKRLSNSFGIGIIRLDLYNVDDSEIVIPAKTNENLDWETMNKLANANPDFKEFLKRIKNDARNNEIIKEKYDKIYDSEELKINLPSIQ